MPVTMLAVSYQVMLVKASDPARNLQEFIANARQRPGQLNYASIGIGSAPHLAAEMVKSAAKIDLVHVPYRGSSAQAMTAMIAGDVSMFMNGTASSIPHIHSGALRGLAVTAPHRVAGLPDVPTFAEAGLPGVEVVLWFAALVPAGTPPAIVKKLHADLVQATSDPEFKKALETRGLEVRTIEPRGAGRVHGARLPQVPRPDPEARAQGGVISCIQLTLRRYDRDLLAGFTLRSSWYTRRLLGCKTRHARLRSARSMNGRPARFAYPAICRLRRSSHSERIPVKSASRMNQTARKPTHSRAKLFHLKNSDAVMNAIRKAGACVEISMLREAFRSIVYMKASQSIVAGQLLGLFLFSFSSGSYGSFSVVVMIR